MNLTILERILLSPFSFLYGIIISTRNLFYDTGILKSSRFSIPIICVGNLSIGGAGKTPHVEFLIKAIAPYINVGVLSRGYKRKSKGFLWISSQNSVLESGDEPLMFAKKYSNIVVAVAENRAIAIPKMVLSYPTLQSIILDDGYQHRSVSADLSILLTTFDNPFTQDYLMPSGRLREYRSAYKRADIIIITKCPTNDQYVDKQMIISTINPLHHQKIYFSYYKYKNPYKLFYSDKTITLDSTLDVVLLSAIANTKYLLDYLADRVSRLHHMNYEDHHLFSDRDIEYIEQVFTNRTSNNKIILTTEKDAIRLNVHKKTLLSLNLPIFVLPVEVAFHFDETLSFVSDVKRFLLNYKS